MPKTEYNHENPSTATREDCEAVVGKSATLSITGTIVEARESPAGHFVIFQPDERWGIEVRLGMDLEIFEIHDA